MPLSPIKRVPPFPANRLVKLGWVKDRKTTPGRSLTPPTSFRSPQFLSAGPFEWREQALGVHALPFPPRHSASTSPCSFSSVTSCAAASCDLLVQRGAAPPLVARLLHPQGEGPAQIAADIGHFAIVAFLARSLVLHECVFRRCRSLIPI